MIDDRDWSALTLGDRIKQGELDGYLVIPDLLDADHIARLKEETARLETTGVDYSVHQQGCPYIQFNGGAITDLIAHPPTVSFLEEVFGDRIVLSHYGYARSEPGHPGISFHTDGQPYGSRIFGYEGSVPSMIRVLYYLDDQPLDVSPFRVIPRSHLSLHADGNPYKRFEDHPEAAIVPSTEGSAVFLNHKTFHGNCPNTGGWAREMLAIAYRPAWAGPVDDVDEWPEEEVEKLPTHVRRFFELSKNTREWEFGGGNKPANMKSEAPGINPSRWERT